jgi:hypothetical protein
MRISLCNLIVASQHGALRSLSSMYLQNLTVIAKNSQPQPIPETTRYINREILALQLPPALNLNKLGNVIIAQLLWRISLVKKI